MMNEQTHLMVLKHTHPDGAEEWICPECGRRIMIEWPPAYRKVVLDEGDVNVAHSGSKGGLSVSAQEAFDPIFDQEEIPANTSEDDVEFEFEQHRLAPWLHWMDAIGFEDLWEDGPHNSGRA